MPERERRYLEAVATGAGAWRLLPEYLESYPNDVDALFHLAANERRGETQQAADHYSRFVAFWKDCDPELGPLVMIRPSASSPASPESRPPPDSRGSCPGSRGAGTGFLLRPKR